jgi:hypothetical protein
MLPVLPRLPDVGKIINGGFYFILHAPRQSGKTTLLDFLTDKINSEGEMYALTVSLATLQYFDDMAAGASEIIAQLNQAMMTSTIEIFQQKADTYDLLPGMSSPSRMARLFLTRLCHDLDKELVIFFDEADCLQEAPLIVFLAQIRDGYNSRHKKKFPKSMALVGMRDIRDYLTLVRPDEESKGAGSPFNIIQETLTLTNFTKDEIQALYRQHTEATGQIFDTSSVARAWHWSEGQPWLVNALAHEVVDKELNHDYSTIITGKHFDQAAQSLILRNPIHFDSLRKRLREPRVRRVAEAVLIGAAYFPEEISGDDIKYTLDLGLLKIDSKNSSICLPANPIYQEVIVRALSEIIQRKIATDMPDPNQSKWMDGTTLDMNGLLKAFQSYWAANCEMFIKNNMLDKAIINSIDNTLSEFSASNQAAALEYFLKTVRQGLINLANEALTHLVLFAFLQRALNGGADYIHRKCALGTLRADICVSYKGALYPIELKIKGRQSKNESLEQIFNI